MHIRVLATVIPLLRAESSYKSPRHRFWQRVVFDYAHIEASDSNGIVSGKGSLGRCRISKPKKRIVLPFVAPDSF